MKTPNCFNYFENHYTTGKPTLKDNKPVRFLVRDVAIAISAASSTDVEYYLESYIKNAQDSFETLLYKLQVAEAKVEEFERKFNNIKHLVDKANNI